MSFGTNVEAGKGPKAKVYIIHRGEKNQKVKGFFELVEDKQLGTSFLVGEEITGTHQLRGEVIEVKQSKRYNITGLKVTVKG